ncbi:hypothetical protein ID866_8884 [Astraeus odoratus]|nr:hypothetical protein ID866_8884 [Astraeus odoratus]
MVSPWMERGIASDYVRNKGVDPRPLLLGIAKGVRYLHNHKSGPIIHGSLTGANVFISIDGRPQITAFSCSFSCCPISEKALSCACESTTRWLAPEQIDDRTTTVKGDVWAFAMTALVCL